MNKPLQTASCGAHIARAERITAPHFQLPVWRASLRMAAVAAAGILAAGVIAGGISGCADMPSTEPTSVLRDANAWGLQTTKPEDAPAALSAHAQWWQDFGDAQLNRLVTQALAANPSLKVAQARLARAQAAADVADAASLPQLNAQGDATRQRYTKNGLVPAPLAGTISENGTAQLQTSWELDFFGKHRAALDAALGSTHAAEADAQAARLLLASQVTRTYFQLARLQAQKALANRTLTQRSETLQLVQERVGAGVDSQLELRQSEGSLPEARLQLESLQEQIALTRNALSALLGQPDAASNVTPPPLPKIKAMPAPTAIPADLLSLRPDITAARWRVEASVGDVAQAKTQFYPNINLVAFAGFSSIGLSRLFQSSSQQWGVGPALRLPIFDAGRLRANLRGKTADLDAAVESYNAVVLDAIHDVADQLASSQAITRQQTEQRAAQQAAEGAYDIALQRYKAGMGNYLHVLTAESNVLAQRRGAVDLAARALDAQVGLMRALGGGYVSDMPAQMLAHPPTASP